mmetsp:Transcript_41467/g.107386  ORF Transcript_41467/g.107386 Transcript_41467/m.107386 type:complete len:233 (-) Transcript_41467:17-715(-)
MYVPLPQTTRKWRFCASASSRQRSNLDTYTSRAGLSISFPLRASSYSFLPFILMAENIGGTCWMSPRKASRAANSSSSVMCSHGAVCSTADSLSYDGVPSPSRMVPVYSFSCAMKESTCLVPLPTHTMTSPVAMGSSVPAWPTFLILSAPRSLPHRSKEVQSIGLSISTIAFCHVSMAGISGGTTCVGSGGSFFLRCCVCGGGGGCSARGGKSVLSAAATHAATRPRPLGFA